MDYRSVIRLDHNDERPLYQQIVDQILDRQRKGAFPPGFRLPPTRTLSRQLGVNRNTVVRAFEELQAAGAIAATVGRGSFVAEPERPQASAQPELEGGLPWASILSKRLEASALGRADRLTRVRSSAELINLQRMQPSSDLLPVDELRRCVDHVLRTRKGRALAYAPREGAPELREQVAAMLSHEGVPARADDVVITSGSQQAIDLIGRALIDPGDPVMLESLSYSGAINIFAAHGASLVGVGSDEEGPDLRLLDRAGARGAKLFYLIPNSRNPTGTTISAKRREGLVDWSRRMGVPLLEDDYGADLDLDALPVPPPLRALDADVIHVGTFSKRLIPALRVGYVVCPKALKPALLTLKHAADLGGSLVLQLALAEYLARGYLRGHLRHAIPEYRARRDALEASLGAHLPPEVKWRHVERGVALWLQLPRGMDPELVFRAAERRGVLVSPGELSSVGDGSAPGVRLTFCAEPAARLKEAGKRIGAAIREVLESKPERSAPLGEI